MSEEGGLAATLTSPKVLIPVSAILLLILLTVGGYFVFGGWLVAFIVALAVVLVFLLGFLLWSALAAQREKTLLAGTQREQQQLAKQDEGSAAQARLTSLVDRFGQGLAALKSSKRAKDLPWYLVIGDIGAGKSSAIRHSGLDLPAEYERLVEAGATGSLTWWLTNQATVLDVAGRYLLSDDGHDRREWRQLLKLIRRNGPRRPLSGVFVALPAPTVLDLDPGEIERRAHMLRRRINEINDELRHDVPIYFLVTQVDRVEGMLEWTRHLPQGRLDEAMGWTCTRRALERHGEALERGFEPVIENLEKVLPDLLLREADPQRRRRMFLLPQEVEALVAAVGRFLDRTFERSVYARTPFLRGVYLTSAEQGGESVSGVLGELGHPWATGPVGPRGQGGALFLRDLFRSIIVDPQEGELARRTKELRPWARRSVFGLAFAGAATVLTLTAVSSFRTWRGIDRVADDTASVLLPSPRLSALDRLRKTIEGQEQAVEGFWRGMGMRPHTYAALDRAKRSYSSAFQREQERPTKTNLLARVRGSDNETFSALAQLALDVVYMQTRGDTRAPDLSKYTELRGEPDAAERFAADYAAWVRWAPDKFRQVSLDIEQDVLRNVAPRLLTIENVERWCTNNAGICPPIRYSSYGLPDERGTKCPDGEVAGAYTRETWEGLIRGLVESVQRADSSARTVAEFQDRYRAQYESEWRQHLVCAAIVRSRDPKLTESGYVQLIGSTSHNLQAPGVWPDGKVPEWAQVVIALRRDEPKQEGEVPPWTSYMRKLGEAEAAAERARTNKNEANPNKAIYREGIDLVANLMPIEGEGDEQAVRSKLNVMLKTPFEDGVSSEQGTILAERNDQWRARIYRPFSGKLGPGELQRLYGPGGALDSFKREILKGLYDETGPISVNGRRPPFGRKWLAWMKNAQVVGPALTQSIARTVRFQGRPTIRERGDAFVTRRDLVVRCPEAVQRFEYREGSGAKSFSWTPACDSVEMRVWIRDPQTGTDRELRARTWTGAMAFINFVQQGRRVSGDLLEWRLNYPDQGIELIARYEVAGSREIRKLAHEPPPETMTR